MIIDNEFPYDFSGDTEGKPKYEDLVDYCRQQGHKISKSAIGRFGKRMRTLAKMKDAGVVVREVMGDLTGEKASQTQQACAEMITAHIISVAADNDNLSPKQLRDLACTARDCMAISIKSSEYVSKQLEEKAKAAAEKISDLTKNKQIDQETLMAIRQQVYGIIE